MDHRQLTFFQLFRRDCRYYRRTFAALALTSALTCALLTGALLIGDSLRGTLESNLKKNAAFVRTLFRFPLPVETTKEGGVLRADGYSPVGKATLYAFPNNAFPNGLTITGRDAYGSGAMADALQKTLGLKIGDLFTVRVQNFEAIDSESPVGRPPELKQIPLVFRGVWDDRRAEVNLENPQTRAMNLFVSPKLLAETLGVGESSVNEIWSPEKIAASALPDETIFNLSQLEFGRWRDRPILQSRAFYLPKEALDACPEATRGLTLFAESISDGQTALDYFFVGAFDGDLFPVQEGSAVLAENLPENFPLGATLTCFTTDSFRTVGRTSYHFFPIEKRDDSAFSDVLTPKIPGLTDEADCERWKAELPIDLEKINRSDRVYWNRYRSKPKLYLNYKQAQKLFAPNRCSVLLFEPGTDPDAVQRKIVAAFRRSATLWQVSDVTAELRKNIEDGTPFASLFLGLSFFIIVSSLLVLATLLKLHWTDRADETRLFARYTNLGRSLRFYRIGEALAVLLPGMALGLVAGTFLARFQLWLLERVWNDIVGMNRLEFHASLRSFFEAFGATLVVTLAILWRESGPQTREATPYRGVSRPFRSVLALGTLSFFRRFRDYRFGVFLLVLGYLGTLGVGSFGIKVRGEDGFGYDYVVETALPVLPASDAPFPKEVLPIRVGPGDRADCANLLRVPNPTLYGVDLEKLTGDASFLAPFVGAADVGSMKWIMKKKIGDAIIYPGGSITLGRTMKASVFQRGVLTNNETFEALFPRERGARFFLIRDQKTAEAFARQLEPFGATLRSVDDFLADAEKFQNRYLAIFLQLAALGFLLGIGSLALMIVRNLHARREDIRLLSELGFSDRTIFHLFTAEYLLLIGLSAVVSLIILSAVACVTRLHVPTLLVGWSVLTLFATGLILSTLKIILSKWCLPRFDSD